MTGIEFFRNRLRRYGFTILFVLLPFLGGLFTSCGGGDSMPVKVNRLDLALRDTDRPLPPEMEDAARTLFALSGYGALTDSALSVYAASPSILVHAHAVDSLWSDLRPLESSLGRMKFNYAHLFPDNVFPSVYAVVSPFNQSVFTADTLLFLGLNHYLGASYAPYGYFPDFIRQRKVPARILPDIAEAIMRRDYPYQPQSEYPTVLSRMLYEGALTEAVMQLAGMSEQEALGYTDEQMAWLEKNERRIWEKLVGGKMLFSTDLQLASSLVSPAPFTSAVSPESPGMAGRFIGHRIVNAYLDRRARPVSWLLTPAFYESQTSLSDSGYN